VSRRRHPATPKLLVFIAATAGMALVLSSIIGNISLRPTRSYTAIFTDALGMHPGNEVRLAGVVVGRVEEIELVDGRHAKVTFNVEDDVPVFRNAEVHARYADLVGNRYLALVERPSGAARMPEGGTFGRDQTRPALNLTVLFNGFQPLFKALSPKEVNKLSYEIIQTLQGEGGNLAMLMRDTAQLTQGLAEKDAVIGRVVRNLTAVLTTLDERDGKLTALIVRFRDLMRGLAGDKDTLNQALPDMAALLDAGGDLLRDVRAPLKDDIGHLGALSGKLAAHSGDLDRLLNTLPGKLATINRTASYGSWFNFYLCSADVRISLLGEAIQLNTPKVSANENDTVCAGRRPR
jgi:phospholipid/cholesterol/gamma-HCH transport system substrate-binding protein